MNKTLISVVLLTFLCAGASAQTTRTHGSMSSPRGGNFAMPSQSSGSYTPGKVTMPPAPPLRTQSTARTYDNTSRQSPSSQSKQTGSPRAYQAPAVAAPILDPDGTTSRVIHGEAVPVSGAKTAKPEKQSKPLSETKSKTQEQSS